MKTIAPSERGRAGVTLHDMPRPDCPPGSVRVRRIAASVNRVDLYMRTTARARIWVIVTVGATTGAHPSADIRRLFLRQLSIHGSTMGSMEEFRRLIRARQAGGFAPRIDSIFPLAKVPAAFGRLEDPARLGKILIRIA